MTGSMMERLEENKFLITQSPNHLITLIACKHEPFASSKTAETRMNSAFAGGGGSNSKPSKAFRHITYFAKKLRGYKTGLT